MKRYQGKRTAATWDLLPYACVQSPEAYPPGTTPSSMDSAILESFSCDRGTGQGDPISPINYVAIDDIIATGLRLLHSDLAQPTSVGGDGNLVYAHDNSRYADDSQCGSFSSTVIQRKVDLVSAFCIVLGLQLSHGKIRRLVQHFLPAVPPDISLSMVVHTTGWQPHILSVQTTGTT